MRDRARENEGRRSVQEANRQGLTNLVAGEPGGRHVKMSGLGPGLWSYKQSTQALGGTVTVRSPTS